MPTLVKDFLIILIPTLLITGLSVAFGWDESIATALHNPESELAWVVRQYSNIPGAVITLAFLGFILLPWRHKFPLVRQTAYVWLFTLIIGGGLFIHVVFKEATDRPRPRETVLLGGDVVQTEIFASDRAEIKGKSFPSGHAAMAAAFIIPVFTLRRRFPKSAIALGTFAVAYTAAVSLSRMTLGAHFMTDCLWGFSFIALFAALGHKVFHEQRDIKPYYILSVLVVALFCLVWFNKFKLSFSYKAKDALDIHEITLDCPLDNITIKNSNTLRLDVTYRGYGAPLSWLALKEEEGELSLERSFGLYRDMTCQVDRLELPLGHILLQTTLEAR